MKARFPGRCSNCGAWIRIGDEIVRAATGWQCDQGDGAGCPADHPEPNAFDGAGAAEQADYDDFMRDCGDR